MRKTIALLLAGGVGSRLNVLAQVRAKPAVTFGGNYRIIDFTLSNIANSGIENVGILTQYKPYSLMKHIGTGAAWDFIGRSRRAKILPPKTGLKDNDWYRGTADAVAQNFDFINRFKCERVLILSGDHIYYMNYLDLVDFHKAHKTQLTIATRVVSPEMAPEFGIAQVDENYKIIHWEEKPRVPRSNLASMGIYLFNTDFLRECLQQAEGHDFGKNVIPWVLEQREAYAFPFDAYWQDVGTIKAYWDANMDLINPNSGLNLEHWKIRTNPIEEEMKRDRIPTYLASRARVSNSIISQDCQIFGEVVNSIISPGVIISEGARVIDSVVMHDTFIGENTTLRKTIVDKNSYIGDNCFIGYGNASTPNKRYPKHINSGITVIGKAARIKPNIKISRNCLVFYGVDFKCFQQHEYEAGSTIYSETAEIPF